MSLHIAWFPIDSPYSHRLNKLLKILICLHLFDERPVISNIREIECDVVKVLLYTRLTKRSQTRTQCFVTIGKAVSVDDDFEKFEKAQKENKNGKSKAKESNSVKETDTLKEESVEIPKEYEVEDTYEIKTLNTKKNKKK